MSSINFLGNLNNIPIYIDPYMDNETVLRGHSNGKIYMIVGTEISKTLSNIILKNTRRDKLDKINLAIHK